MSNVLNPRCPVCREPVDITTAKTDAAGQAVHEDCYLFTLGIAEGKKPHGKESGNE